MVGNLAEAGRREVEPWVRGFLKSDNLILCGNAAMALLHFSPEEGISECNRVFLSVLDGKLEMSTGCYLLWISDTLREFGTAESTRAAEELEKRINFPTT